MSLDRRVLFIINSKSGSSDSKSDEATLERIMLEAEISYKVIHLSEDDARAEISETISNFKPDTVVAGGGDGTVNFVASLIAGSGIMMGILPMGSANGMAYELGITGNIEDALRLIVKGEASPLDIVRLNDDHISLHLADLGINARIIKEFEKEGKRGFSAYLKHFVKELVKPQQSFKCTITTGHRVISHHAYMTLIANANRYRTGANINPSGLMDDGFFEVIMIRPYSRWIWRSFIGAFTGTFHKKPHVEVFKCTEATITSTPAQELQVDGENLGKVNKVVAVIEKHALRVIKGG